MNWEDIAEQKMQPPMLPYVQGPGDPSNFEEYDPEDPVTADEVYDEEYLMVRFTYAFSVALQLALRIETLVL